MFDGLSSCCLFIGLGLALLLSTALYFHVCSFMYIYISAVFLCLVNILPNPPPPKIDLYIDDYSWRRIQDTYLTCVPPQLLYLATWLILGSTIEILNLEHFKAQHLPLRCIKLDRWKYKQGEKEEEEKKERKKDRKKKWCFCSDRWSVRTWGGL